MVPSTSRVAETASRAAILAALTRRPGLSRSELAQTLGYGPATIGSQVRRLLEAGFLRELEPRSNGNGRPKIPLECVTDVAYVIGMSVLPDHLTLAAVGIDGAVLAESTAPFDPVANVVTQISRPVRDLVANLADRGTCIAIGLALSGVVDSFAGTVAVSVIMGWRDVSLGRELSEAIGVPVFVDNDVYVAATHTLTFGKSAVPDSFLLLSIGQGIGMAIVSERRVLRGMRGASSEFGHISVDPNGRPCPCGNIGCLQGYAGLGEMTRDLEAAIGHPLSSFEGLAALASGADHRAQEILGGAGTLLGRAVGGVVTLLGINQVLVTGRTTAIWSSLASGFATGLAVTTPTLSNPPSVSLSSWAENDDAVGAAALALNRALDGSTPR